MPTPRRISKTNSAKSSSTKSAVARKAKPKTAPEPVTEQKFDLEVVAQSSELTTTNKTAEVLSTISSLALSEMETLLYDYSKIPEDFRDELKAYTIELKGRRRSSFLDAIRIGEILVIAKSKLQRGQFMEWSTSEFEEFSQDTLKNYMNSYELTKSFSHEELKVLPMAILYKMGRGSVPLEAQREIVQLQLSQDEPVSKKKAAQIIQQYRRHQLEIAGVSDRVKDTLINSPLSEDKDELNKLSRLSVNKQVQVVEFLEQNEDLNVRQALQTINKKKNEPEVIDAEEVVTVTGHQIQETHQGNWLNLLSSLENESVDLCLAELPLNQAALSDYSSLANEMDRVLKPGGMLLSVVGQQNIQFVGRELEPLQVAWTFMIRRRPGNSPRVVGRITYASSYVPLSLSYKPPLRHVPGLIDDLQIEDIPANVMTFHFDGLQENENKEEDTHDALISIESSLSYYISRLLRPTDVFVHLVRNSQLSFNIGETICNAAFNSNAARVISLVGN